MQGLLVQVAHSGATVEHSRYLKFMHLPSTLGIALNLRSLTGFDTSNYFFPYDARAVSFVRRLLRSRQYAIVQCEQPWSLVAVSDNRSDSSQCLALDEHNVEYHACISASTSRLLASLTYRTEEAALKMSDIVFAVSNADKLGISRIYGVPSRKISVIPNGVAQELLEIEPRATETERCMIFFHGLLSWKANSDAAMVIIRELAPRLPQALFVIAGGHYSATLAKEARKQSNVKLVGEVEDIMSWIAAADVCVVPIFGGSGTRLKTLEYMAASKAIVTTPTGALGLPIRDHVHAIMCEGVEEILAEIKELVKSPRARSELGSAARALAKDFTWGSITQKLAAIYRNMNL